MPRIKDTVSGVVPRAADEALRLANGDRKAAYSQYIILMYRATGRLVPGCDNKDLQAYYDKKGMNGNA